MIQNTFKQSPPQLATRRTRARRTVKLFPTGLLDAKVDDAEMTNYSTKATTYPRIDVDTKFTYFIDGAPEALNALKELSDALEAHADVSTTALKLTGTKANTTDVTTSLSTTANTTAFAAKTNENTTSNSATAGSSRHASDAYH